MNNNGKTIISDETAISSFPILSVHSDCSTCHVTFNEKWFWSCSLSYLCKQFKLRLTSYCNVEGIRHSLCTDVSKLMRKMRWQEGNQRRQNIDRICMNPQVFYIPPHLYGSDLNTQSASTPGQSLVLSTDSGLDHVGQVRNLKDCGVFRVKAWNKNKHSAF